jgi:hypothetical protein
MSWEALREGLMSLSLPSLGVDTLRSLAKFGVPSQEEREAIAAYLQVGVYAGVQGGREA